VLGRKRGSKILEKKAATMTLRPELLDPGFLTKSVIAKAESFIP
jgi:hypothetical protein